MSDDYEDAPGGADDASADPKERARRELRREARRQSGPSGAGSSDTGGGAAADAADCCISEVSFDLPKVECCISEVSFDGPDCFVATATLGPRHPDLDDLRGFRDRVLARHRAGRWFTYAYYRYGTYAARYIKDKPILKLLVREGIVRPLARLARRLA